MSVTDKINYVSRLIILQKQSIETFLLIIIDLVLSNKLVYKTVFEDLFERFYEIILKDCSSKLLQSNNAVEKPQAGGKRRKKKQKGGASELTLGDITNKSLYFHDIQFIVNTIKDILLLQIISIDNDMQFISNQTTKERNDEYLSSIVKKITDAMNKRNDNKSSITKLLDQALKGITPEDLKNKKSVLRLLGLLTNIYKISSKIKKTYQEIRDIDNAAPLNDSDKEIMKKFFETQLKKYNKFYENLKIVLKNLGNSKSKNNNTVIKGDTITHIRRFLSNSGNKSIFASETPSLTNNGSILKFKFTDSELIKESDLTNKNNTVKTVPSSFVFLYNIFLLSYFGQSLSFYTDAELSKLQITLSSSSS